MAAQSPLALCDVDGLVGDDDRAIRDTFRAYVEKSVRPHMADWYETGEIPAKELARDLGSLGVLPSGTPRVVAALLFGAVFGLGETLMAPTMGPLVNALATDRLRGRYNALSGATFSVAFVIAPGIAGALIGFGFATVWLALLVLGCVGVAVVARRLPRRLTDEQDGLAALVAADDPAQRLAV